MYLLSLCEAGGGVNCAIAKTSATGIIKVHPLQQVLTPILRQQNIPSITSQPVAVLSPDAKRKANTKAKVTVENFAE